MPAHEGPRAAADLDINHLRQGGTYAAYATTGLVGHGEYLGIEVAYDEWRILLRTRQGTRSIPLAGLESVTADAA